MIDLVVMAVSRYMGIDPWTRMSNADDAEFRHRMMLVLRDLGMFPDITLPLLDYS